MKKWFLKNFMWFLPASLTIIIAVPLIVWLKIDTNLSHWDMARQLFISAKYQSLWHDFFAGHIGILYIFGFYAYYPMVIHHLALLFYWIFGADQDAAVYSNIIWIFILLFSVFNISRKYWDIKSGIIAMLVILSSPILIGQMREFQIDLPLTSIVSLTLYLLIKSENFNNNKYSVLIGVVAGIGMLTKWTYLAYAGPAIVLFLIFGLRQKDKRNNVIKNVIIAFLVTIAICGYWYIKNLEFLKHDFATNGIAVAKLEGDPVGFTSQAFSWYLKFLNRDYLYLPLAILILVSLLYSTVLNKDIFKKTWPLVFLAVVYYLIFSILPNKDARYIMPVMVIIAVIISSLVSISKKMIYQILLFLAVVSIFVLNNAAVSFGKYWGEKEREKILFNNTNYYYYGVLISDIGGYTSESPKQKICPLEEIVDQIPTNNSAKLVGEDSMFVNDWEVGFLLIKNGKIYSRDLPESDYLLFKDGPQMPDSISNLSSEYNVTLVNSFDCSDGYKIHLTKVNK